MDYVEALRIQDRLREYGWRSNVRRIGPLHPRWNPMDPRWEIIAVNARGPMWYVSSGRMGAKLLMAIQREGWYGQLSA